MSADTSVFPAYLPRDTCHRPRTRPGLIEFLIDKGDGAEDNTAFTEAVTQAAANVALQAERRRQAVAAFGQSTAVALCKVTCGDIAARFDRVSPLERGVSSRQYASACLFHFGVWVCFQSPRSQPQRVKQPVTSELINMNHDHRSQITNPRPPAHPPAISRP